MLQIVQFIIQTAHCIQKDSLYVMINKGHPITSAPIPYSFFTDVQHASAWCAYNVIGVSTLYNVPSIAK